MSCSVNFDTIKSGIETLIKKEASKLDIANISGNDVTLNKKVSDYQSFIDTINNNFSSPVVYRSGENTMVIDVPNKVVNDYLMKTKEGQDAFQTSELMSDANFPQNSLNNNELFTALNYPEIDQITYDKLNKFLTTINPNFRVEEVDNLSESGKTSLKDFLISVKTLSKFKALPEEVAHVIIEMMPDDSNIKSDLINNVTSFPIYSSTYQAYKDNPQYQRDGKPNYEKIKREAAAKLLSEYIYALSSGDKSRIDQLTRPKEGFIKKWFNKFMSWLGFEMNTKLHLYQDLAAEILTGEVDMNWKNENDVSKLAITDNYFFQLSQKELYQQAAEIYEKNPPHLLDVITKFSKEFGKKFHEILKEQKYNELNEELRKDGTSIGKINRLVDIQQTLYESTRINLKNALDAGAYLKGLKQFLEAMDNMEMLSSAMLKVIKNKDSAKTFDEAIDNIKQLEGYMGVYETFKNIVDAELVDTLVKANTAPEVIRSIQNTSTNFQTVNAYIIDKLRNDLGVFYKEILSGVNEGVLGQLNDELKVEQARTNPNPDVIKRIQEKIGEHVQNDESILAMLAGKGKDIDKISNMNYLINASILNGDVYISGMSKYINTRIEEMQRKASTRVNELYAKIDPIQKKLNEAAHITGAKITTIDHVYDPTTKTNREVLTFLSPTKNAQPLLAPLKQAYQDAYKKYIETDTNKKEEKEAAHKDYIDKLKAYNDFVSKYMNRPFVSEYYNFKKEFEDDPVFVLAMDEYKNLTSAIKELEEIIETGHHKDGDDQELAELYRERARLLFDEDEKGNKKEGDALQRANALKNYFERSGRFKELDDVQTERAYLIARNIYNQKVNSALHELREKNVSTIGEAEKKLKEILEEKRLRIENQYLISKEESDTKTGKDVNSKELDYDILEDVLMGKWERRNIVLGLNDKYYEDEKLVWNRIKELKNKGELSEAEKQIAAAYEILRGIKFGSRDKLGQINPDSFTEDELDQIAELEDFIEDAKQDIPKATFDPSAMSPEDKARYDSQIALIGDKATPAGRVRAAKIEKARLERKYKNSGKNQELKELFNLLGSMSKKVPTEYYWDKMDMLVEPMAEFRTFLEQENQKSNKSESEKKEVSEVIRDFYYSFLSAVDTRNDDELDFEVYKSGAFVEFLEFLKNSKYSPMYDWFIENHVEKSVFDQAEEKYVKLPYVRGSVYQFKIPTQDEYIKPSFNKKYLRYRVKDEFRTGYNPQTKKVDLKEGLHITNRHQNGFPEFLPLSREQGAPADSPFINEKYYELKNGDSLRFQYLETVKNHDLEEQAKLPSQLRRWMNVPVDELSKIEEKKHIPAKAKGWGQYIQNLFKKTEAGSGQEELLAEKTIEEVDQLTQETFQSKIPKVGMAQRIPIDQVSKDILKSVAKFTFKTHEFEGRSEPQPVVQALLKVMDANAKSGYLSNKERAKKFEQMYSQKILQEVPDSSFNKEWMRKVTRFLTANTSLRLLADLPGGAINYMSANVNNLIESFACKYINPVQYIRGNIMAGKMNMDMMADFNKKTGLSYSTLLFNTFDFLQGEFEEDLLDRSSSQDKWSSVRRIMMIPRKAGELMAQTALGMGMLERVKVKNELDGKDYPIHQIFQKNAEGTTLELKAGFPQEWNPVDGKAFVRLKQLMNRVNLELHGNYAKINQSEASRHSLGKLAENMKRWFMPAFQRRFGRETPDIMFEELTEGYYTTAAKAAANLFKAIYSEAARAEWRHMMSTPRYKQNLQRAGTEAVIAALLFTMFTVFLGYSGPDKNKNLKENSWMHNMAILLMLRTYSETTAYIPLPPWGFQEMKRNVLTPFTLPSDSVSNFAALVQLGLFQVGYWFGMDIDQKDLYYSKDSGYWYNQKGMPKILKYLLNTVGYRGYTLEPTQYIKDFENIQNRLK